MATKGRGGYQEPSNPAPVSGPGKFSKRTDGGPGQKIQTPSIDRDDIQHGDIQNIEQAQHIQRIPNRSGPAASPAPASPPAVAAGGALPPFIFGRDSARPNEATTAGLDMGPGDGSEILSAPPLDEADDREIILDWLANTYGNNDAAQMLKEIQDSKRPKPAPLQVVGDTPPVPGEDEMGPLGAMVGDLGSVEEDPDDFDEDIEDEYDPEFDDDEDMSEMVDDEETLDPEAGGGTADVVGPEIDPVTGGPVES